MKRIARWIWLSAGALSVVFGVIGAFLPVLPTTPFMILAAYCFARSSPRAHAWLLDNPYFGRQVRDYYAGKGIPVRTKLIAVSMVTLSWAYVLMTAEEFLVRAVMTMTWLAVSGYMLFIIPTRKRGAEDSPPTDSAQ